MKKIYLISFVIFCILLLNACFSPWTSGEGTITFNFGSSNTNARNGYFVNVDDFEYKDFRHEVHFLSANGNFFKVGEFAGDRGTVTVPVGTYKVIVKGYGFLNDGDNEELRSYGISETTYTITAGKNENVPVEMFSAVEVTSWEHFFTIVNEVNEENSNSLLPYQELYILLSGEKDGYTLNDDGGIEIISCNITLIAENDLVIDCGSFDLGSMFIVGQGDKLTLGVEGMVGSITLKGNSDGSPFPLIYVFGTLVMNDRVTIKDHVNNDTEGDGRGGGVYVDGGTFDMYGGEIVNNKANQGAGVFMSGGTFNMESGSITQNKANQGTIGDNRSSGGGVFVAFEAIFYLKGGAISHNESHLGGGGGIYVSGSTVEIHDGSLITENIAKVDTASGGGMFISGVTSVVTMYGGDITKNTANNGGGVFFAMGTFNMYGGTIGGSEENANSANNAGGGVAFYVDTTGAFVVGGTAVISSNIATDPMKGNNVFLQQNAQQIMLLTLGVGANAPVLGMEIWVTRGLENDTAGTGVIVQSATFEQRDFFKADQPYNINYTVIYNSSTDALEIEAAQ